MWANRALSAMVGFWLGASVAAAAADGLDEFNRAVEGFSSHHRVALAYLRTGNLDLASVELERMNAAWQAVMERFGANRPAEIIDQALYTSTVTDISTRIIAAHLVMGLGRPDVAHDALSEARNALARLRRASGIAVLADCVLDAGAAMTKLMAFDRKAPDWGDAAARQEVLAAAAAHGDELRRCNDMAPASVRLSAEFRRLIDGALASLERVPEAVAARDGDLLHRLLIELQSFDRLLSFRFG
jgi:hypothetical protein